MSSQAQEKEIQLLKEQVSELKNEVQKLKYNGNENFKQNKKCKCDEPKYMKIKTISKFVGKDMDILKIPVAYVCKCGGHYNCYHMCDMFQCNEKVECGYRFCKSCFDKLCKHEEYYKQGIKCRCKANVSAFVEPEGTYCSEHCKTMASYCS